MKIRAKRIILSLIFVILTGFCIGKIYKVLSWKDTSGAYFSSITELKKLPKNTVEVVAMGSSKAYGSFDPAFLWENKGIASMNLSIAGMDQQSAYYHLVELLKTQSPKVVFMEGSLLYTDKYQSQGNVYRNTIVMAPSKNNIELIKAIVDSEKTLDYFLRFPIVHSRYKELKKDDFAISATDRGRLGFIPGFDNIPQSDVNYAVLDDSETFIEASPSTCEWIKKLYDLSKSEGFDIVFYLAPQNMLEYYKHQYNGVCKELDKYGIEHIDFNQIRDIVGLDYLTDLSDSLHCNDNGSQKIMAYLVSYLDNNYEFKDNRGNELYRLWDENQAYIFHERFENTIATLEPKQAINELEAMGDILVITFSRDIAKVVLNKEILFEAHLESADFSLKINDSDYCYVTSLATDDGLNTIAYIGQTPYYIHGDGDNMCVAYDLIRENVIYWNEY